MFDMFLTVTQHLANIAWMLAFAISIIVMGFVTFSTVINIEGISQELKRQSADCPFPLWLRLIWFPTWSGSVIFLGWVQLQMNDPWIYGWGPGSVLLTLVTFVPAWHLVSLGGKKES